MEILLAYVLGLIIIAIAQAALGFLVMCLRGLLSLLAGLYMLLLEIGSGCLAFLALAGREGGEWVRGSLGQILSVYFGWAVPQRLHLRFPGLARMLAPRFRTEFPGTLLVSVVILGGMAAFFDSWMFSVLFPSLVLIRPAKQWTKTLIRVGWSGLRVCGSMLSLDHSRSTKLETDPEFDARTFAAFTLPVTGVAAAACFTLEQNTLLILPMHVFCLTMRRIVRAARPPSILLLGTSGDEASRFYDAVESIDPDIGVATCVDHDPGQLTGARYRGWLRTAGPGWEDTVRALVESSGIVIVDIRRPGRGLQIELDLIRRLGKTCCFISDGRAYSRGRTKAGMHAGSKLEQGLDMSEGELIEILRTRGYRGLKSRLAQVSV